MGQSKIKRELLAPAGSPEALSAAISEGADAVYLGLKDFNARLRGHNFAYAQFEAAVRAIHSRGKKIYAALNTVWTEREADRLYQLATYIRETGADGVIVQDMGTLRMITSCVGGLAIHASTQMNIASSGGCNALGKHSVSRVVLARELGINEIRQIRKNTNVELEVFVHGALCVSASGLCLFSSYLGGKSANRGMCTQACRRIYYEGGTEGKYYFSPHDLELIRKMPELAGAGINSFKIEGRMKSAEYTGTVTAAYRLVLDTIEELGDAALNSAEGENPVLSAAFEKAAGILRHDFARVKTLFHFEEDSPAKYLNASSDGGTGIKLGVINRSAGAGAARKAYIREPRFSCDAGDTIRIHRAGDLGRASHKVHDVSISGCEICFDIPPEFGAGDTVYIIQRKAFSKRIPPVLPSDLSSCKRKPGFTHAPPVSPPRKKITAFPEGVYAAFSHIEDMYIAQSVRPVRAILHCEKDTITKLAGTTGPLPFKASETLLSLDPFFKETDDAVFSAAIEHLIEAGYTNYIVNNIGQIPLFKRYEHKTALVAGPYLYAFNRYAADFIFSYNNIYAIVSPLENSRQNLERVFTGALRGNVFVTVFAFPALFRIQSNLSPLYDFTSFSGSREEQFVIKSEKKQTLVTACEPFSITDKLPFLNTAGFKRFIVDFSPLPIKKHSYRDVMRAAQNASVIPGASRFNWKNGFYTAPP